MMKRGAMRGVAAVLGAGFVLGAASSCTVSPPTDERDAQARDLSVPEAPQQAPRAPQGSQPRVAQAPSSGGAGTVRGGQAPAGSRADRRGRFTVRRLEARDPANIKTRDSGLLEEVIKDMNATIGPKLPVDVPVSFAELGQANAFYTPSKRTIVVSYELLNQMIVLFVRNADRDDPKVAARVAQQVIDTLSFVIYHEAAHAMIDLDDIPITGREEDAADQLATVMIVNSASSNYAQARKRNGMTHTAEGGDAAINGALYFLLSARQSGDTVEDLPFWDEHSLSQQRFYNILTWVYGSDPDKHARLVQQKILPESRAQQAPHEYARMLSSWRKILTDAGAF